MHLSSADLSAAIDPQGAQLSLLRDATGRDLLWHGDPAFWNGRAPILFPIVGALNEGHFTWRGTRYALPRHGFARGRRFEVIRHNQHEALFRQTADAATRAVYPFEFELDLLFRMEARALFIKASVRNSGDEILPASLGFHPAFRWPLHNDDDANQRNAAASREAHFLQFEFDEPAPVRRLDAKGLLIREPQATPVQGRRLMLSDDIFRDDVLIFDHLQSRRVSYGSAAGQWLQVTFPDATHLGIWSKPGAPFVCIEPWRGVADPAGFAGTLAEKPGTFMVPPGGTESLQMLIEMA